MSSNEYTFTKYFLSAPDYKAEYSSLEDARQDAGKLEKYYDNGSYELWENIYNQDAELVHSELVERLN